MPAASEPSSVTSARSPGAEAPAGDVLGGCGLVVADRQDDHLDRRVPGRKRPLMHLDEMAEEALHAADEAAVRHHRPPPLRVAVHVGQVERGGLVEVHLDGGQGPLPPCRVHDLHIDLRTVEGGLAGHLHKGRTDPDQNFP
jgi:hypothetical protein